MSKAQVEIKKKRDYKSRKEKKNVMSTVRNIRGGLG